MNFFAPVLTLLASAAILQLPATPPMKMGLWESTNTMAMTVPGMNMPPGVGNHAMKVRSCLTQESYAQDLARQQQQRDCLISNQTFIGNGYSFDVSCPRNNSSDHFKMTWDSNSGHGAMHMDVKGGSHPMTIDTVIESHYLGSDCGTVKPGSPEIMH